MALRPDRNLDYVSSPRRYYGWNIVAVIALTAFSSAVIINPTLSVFVKPVTSEFDWSRSIFSGATAIGTIAGGLLALVVGPIIDRFGGRLVLSVGFFLLGGLFLLLGSIDTLWQFYSTLILARIILQGVINLTNNVVVAKWFVRQRGRAMAITNLGQRVGSATIPLFAQFMVSRSQGGWRTAAGGLGLLVWGVTLVPVLLWLRRQPSDLGLLPDGEDPRGASKDANSPSFTDFSFTLTETLRTRTFYLLLLGFCIFTFVNTGILFNLLPLFSDRGLTSSQAIAILTTWSLAGIPVTLGVGFLGERLPLRYLLVVAYLGAAVGIFILIRADTVPSGMFFGVVHGSFFAAGLFLQNLVLADYYGPGHLGAIRGVVTPIMMVSNALGPLSATLAFDFQGSYSLILLVDLTVLAVIGLATVLASPPRRKSTAGSSSEEKIH